MRRARWLGVALAVAAGCGGGETTSVGLICERIFQVCDDGLGWESAPACADSWLGDPRAGTDCRDETAYLRCMAPCVEEGTCGAFETCESGCWSDACL
jgi:hypothetical protein